MLKKILSLVLAISMAFGSAAFVFADSNISFDENAANGKLEINQSDAKLKISIKPDEDYSLSKLLLKDENGKNISLRKASALSYEADIEDGKSYSLDYCFRRTIVRLSETELAMKTGETKKLYSCIEYSDGKINTRRMVFDKAISFSSSNPDVVEVSQDGRLTALKPGYSRITATADASNGSEKFCYVIVDGNKEPAIGKLTLVARFKLDDLFKKSDFGHSFLVFESYVDGLKVNNLDAFLEAYDFTDKYYQALKEYTGEGYDPLTYYYLTNGEEPSDDEKQKAELLEYARSLYKKLDTKEVDSFTINKGMIATFGATTISLESFSQDTFVNGASAEILRRNGLELSSLDDLENIELNRENVTKLLAVLKELIYDLSTDYNPFTAGNSEYGGAAFNEELFKQASTKYTWPCVCIETDITKTQFDALIDFLQYDNYFNFLGRNCTQVASDAWNLVTAARKDLHLEPNYGGITKGIAAPLMLQQAILEKSLFKMLDPSVKFYLGHSTFKSNIESLDPALFK